MPTCSSSMPRRTGSVSWHLVARGSTRESWRWGRCGRLHITSLHPPEIAVPSHDQDRHVELIVSPCLFATCGSGELHFMAAYLYHAVAMGLQVRSPIAGILRACSQSSTVYQKGVVAVQKAGMRKSRADRSIPPPSVALVVGDASGHCAAEAAWFPPRFVLLLRRRICRTRNVRGTSILPLWPFGGAAALLSRCCHLLLRHPASIVLLRGRGVRSGSSLFRPKSRRARGAPSTSSLHGFVVGFGEAACCNACRSIHGASPNPCRRGVRERSPRARRPRMVRVALLAAAGN